MWSCLIRYLLKPLYLIQGTREHEFRKVVDVYARDVLVVGAGCEDGPTEYFRYISKTERERRNPLSPHIVFELLPAELSAHPKLDRLLVLPPSACERDRGHYDGYADHDD